MRARSSAWLSDDMGDLVRQHGGELGAVVGQRDEAAGDVEIAARQREGVGDGRVEDGDLVAPRRIVGRRDQPGDDDGDRRLDVRIGIDAAIFGDDARILARADRLLGRARGCAAGRRQQDPRAPENRRSGSRRRADTRRRTSGDRRIPLQMRGIDAKIKAAFIIPRGVLQGSRSPPGSGPGEAVRRRRSGIRAP